MPVPVDHIVTSLCCPSWIYKLAEVEPDFIANTYRSSKPKVNQDE